VLLFFPLQVVEGLGGVQLDHFLRRQYAPDRRAGGKAAAFRPEVEAEAERRRGSRPCCRRGLGRLRALLRLGGDLRLGRRIGVGPLGCSGAGSALATSGPGGGASVARFFFASICESVSPSHLRTPTT